MDRYTVRVGRMVLAGTFCVLMAGAAVRAHGQNLDILPSATSGKVTISGDPTLHPILRRPLSYTQLTTTTFKASANDGFGLNRGDGWPDEINIKVVPKSGTPFISVWKAARRT